MVRGSLLLKQQENSVPQKKKPEQTETIQENTFNHLHRKNLHQNQNKPGQISNFERNKKHAL
jgi:hypothetical protein